MEHHQKLLEFGNKAACNLYCPLNYLQMLWNLSPLTFKGCFAPHDQISQFISLVNEMFKIQGDGFHQESSGFADVLETQVTTCEFPGEDGYWEV